MRLTSAAAIADFFESRIRKARIEHRQAKLHRQLSRLPSYVARDIGIGPNQDRSINFLED